MDLIRMLVLLPLMAFAQQQPPAELPAGEPAALKADGPATKPAIAIPADAQALLDDMGKAYHDLAHLQLAGTLRIDIQIEGEKPEQHDVKFTASFDAPNKFRQDVPNEVLIGSTGTNVYSFKSKDKNYTLSPAPKDRAALSEYPPQVIEALTSQNLSLAMALSSDPGKELISDAASVSKAADTQIDGAGYPTLKIIQDDRTATLVALDASTHLIKEIRNDLTSVLKKRRPDLTSAVISILYPEVKTDAPETAVAYAWTPPAGAIDAATAAQARPGGAEISDGSQLLNKPAPAFKVSTLEGNDFTLASEKGQVVILDFWATWCGPCRMGLPKLDAIYAAHKAQGLKVYAIDKGEDVPTITAFIKSTGLKVPVLLDSTEKVGESYGVEGIPFTVIIAPNGKVVKVFVGYSDKESAEIEAVIKPLLKQAAS